MTIPSVCRVYMLNFTSGRCFNAFSQVPVRYASRTSKYNSRTSRREVFDDDRSIRDFGVVSKDGLNIRDKDYNAGEPQGFVRSSIRNRSQAHTNKVSLLQSIYQYSTNNLLKDRDLTIISKIPIAKMTLILTRSLDQFAKIGGKTYDLNNRYTEANRRIYDYVYIKAYLDDFQDEELDLFAHLLKFKNHRLLVRDRYKYDTDISKSQRKIHELDQLVGIDELVSKATAKFKKENWEDVLKIMESKRVNEVLTDFTDVHDSVATRRSMKLQGPHSGGLFKHVVSDVTELLKKESKSEKHSQRFNQQSV